MTSDFHRVWLSVGSNHADAHAFVGKALDCLADYVGEMKVCEPYTTPAINGIDADYLNTVATGLYAGTVEELNARCKEIEATLGRSRGVKGSHPHVVEIDIDVVCFANEIVRPADYNREYFMRGFNELKADCPDCAL